MRKIINMLLCIILVISMVSCNTAKNISAQKYTKEKSIEGRDASISNLKIHLGQAFNAEIKGDLNKDGTYQNKGKYFLYNLKVEAVRDYNYIVINTKIQNDNDKSVIIHKTGWQAYLNDGTKLPDIKIKEIGESEEILSGSEVNIIILIPINKKLNVQEINLKYDDKNYHDLNSTLVENNDNKTNTIDGIGCVEFNNIKIVK